jgi:hypothetical protein
VTERRRAEARSHRATSLKEVLVKRLIPLVAGGALLAAAPSAGAAVDLSGGSTRLTLNKGTANALGSLGVSVTATGRARARGMRVTFPIRGGAIDPASAAGTIVHRGGLRFRAGGKAITLKSYRVRVGRRITLSALVGGRRAAVLRLTGRPRVTRSGFGTNVSGLTARLTGRGARALNTTFGVSAFRKGLALGRIRVEAQPAETELLPQGSTALALEPATLQAITGLGITPGVIGPAAQQGTTVTFPITGGAASLELNAAGVQHAGGLSMTHGTTVVNLTDFDIRLGGAPQLFASLNGSAAKVPILDLDLTGVQPRISGRTITLPGVTAKLTQAAASGLNAAFGTTAFTAGLVLGRATVQATGK